MSWLLIAGTGLLVGWLTRQGFRTRQSALAASMRKFHLAEAHAQADRCDNALRVLDSVDLKVLGAPMMATWLTNRAYCLARTGHPEEALQQLDDAEVLARNDETLPEGLLLGGIFAIRGIALHLLGEHARAEATLQLAQGLDRAVVPASADPLGELREAQRHLAAERWWWLAEIARVRDDHAEQRARLELAAATPEGGRFAERARAELRALPAPTER